MRWKTFDHYERHPAHWIWMWAPALLLLVVIGLALGGEWLEKQKCRAMGPSKHWRPWLAWYPVALQGEGKTAWLELIERREEYEWREYRSRSGFGSAGEA